MMTVGRLILASASPRRADILTKLGISFDTVPCALPEPDHKPTGLAPAIWAENVAFFKAREVGLSHADNVILGADTIVVCGNDLLGKPRDAEDARGMLELQAGRETDVITGLAVLAAVRSPNQFRAASLSGLPGKAADGAGSEEIISRCGHDRELDRDCIMAHAVTRVWMRDDAAARAAYILSGDWRGKAGAYGIQDVGDRLIERIEGSFTNVVGLPDRLVRRLLSAVGLLDCDPGIEK